MPAPPITAVAVTLLPPETLPGSPDTSETGALSLSHGPRARSGSESNTACGAERAMPARPSAPRSDIVESAAPRSGALPLGGQAGPYSTTAEAELTLLRRPGCTAHSPSPPSSSDPSYLSASACIFSRVVRPGPARAVYARAAEYHGSYGTTRMPASTDTSVPSTGRPMLSRTTSYLTV